MRAHAKRSVLAALSLATLLVALRQRPALADGVPPLELDREDRVETLPAMEWLIDEGGALTLKDVVDGNAAARFRRARAQDLNVGYSSAAFWLRVSLVSRAPSSRLWYLSVYQGIDRAELYYEVRPGQFHQQVLGRRLDFLTRTIPHKTLYFPLDVVPGASRVYLRLRTADTLQLRLTLDSPAAMASQAIAERWQEGLYLGALFALAIYNLFLFFWLRDRAYLYYVVFQTGIALLQASLDQVVFQYLWPHFPKWNAHSETVFVGVALFGAHGFARHFLVVADRPAPGDRLLRGLQWCGVALSVGFPAADAPLFVRAAMLYIFVSCATLLACGVIAWRRGSHNAPFFIAAWTLLLAGTLLATLTALGVVPTTAIAQETTRVGSAAEALLLSLGLAHRIDAMRRERAVAQADLLRTKSEYAARLEQEVADRTRDLTTAVAELKSAQATLVRQARLAALGHLVDGVVHEVGNPLNFVKGGAEDLPRLLGLAQQACARLQETAACARSAEEVTRALADASTAATLVSSGTARIKQIIDNLRSYASSRQMPSRPVDLVEAVRSTVSLVRRRLDEHGIDLTLDLPTLPPIAAQAGEIGQVLTNLIVNSIQAMTDGGRLSITARVEAGRVHVVVEDTGPGVPPDIRDCIFDPFFTTRDPNEGTGLGLAISHEIMRRHGGELHLLDRVQGAAFEMILPVEMPA